MRTRVMEKVPLLTLSAVAACLSSGRNMQTVSVNDPLTPTYISPLKKKKTWFLLGDETIFCYFTFADSQ